MVRRLVDGDTEIPAGRVKSDHALILVDRAAANNYVDSKKE
jgi:hypothetical protein